jgi:tRNA(Ile)-lysidine synthase
MKWPQIPQKLPPFSYKFTLHLGHFLAQNLRSPQKTWAIAVSGGIDSLSLLYALAILKRQKCREIGELQLVHINHRSRPASEHALEKSALKNLAEQLNIAFFYYEATQDGRDSGEWEWRKLRKHFLKEHSLKHQANIIEGHHLDDSWEWHFLQQAKSGDPKKSLGIPYRSGPVIRPFMCVTKKQIGQFARELSIPFFADQTSLNLNLERNFLRANITPMMQARYPKYLKFYALQAQLKAEALDLSWLKIDHGKWSKQEVEGNVVAFLWQSESKSKSSVLPRQAILQALGILSPKKRGSFASQISQLQNAWSNHRSGPIHFSGGVKAKIIKDFRIVFYVGDSISLLEEWVELSFS